MVLREAVWLGPGETLQHAQGAASGMASLYGERARPNPDLALADRATWSGRRQKALQQQEIEPFVVARENEQEVARAIAKRAGKRPGMRDGYAL